MKKILYPILVLYLPVMAFAQYKELPNPPSSMQTLPAGSYVIAMDNTNQVNTAGTFNLKAYGLVVFLLNRNVRISWVIRAGKQKDETDFSVPAAKIKPVAAAAAGYNFKGGPFVIFAPDTAGVALLIDSFYYNPTGGTPVNSLTGNNRPSVYKTDASVAVDVRYSLAGFKPKAAILTDGGNQKIHEGFMADCGIPNASWALSQGTNLMTSCFTFASEPHNDKTNTAAFDTAIKGIRAFVQYGGNFLAQCAAVESYENNVSYGYLQTKYGLTHHNTHNGNDRYINSDLSYAQFEGLYHATQTGHLQSWDVNNGTWANYGYMIANDPDIPGGNDNIAASASKLTNPNIRGGMVFYLGNHDFDVTHPQDINGIRIYMNAYLTPVAINTNCTAGGPLPITWYSFTTLRSGPDVLLEWQTAMETDNSRFDVERSVDGVHFTTIGTLMGAGNSAGMLTYRFRDNSPGTGVFYYRILQADANGNVTYSETRSVLMKATDGFGISIYPNPGKGLFVLASTNMSSIRSIMVLDNLGRQVYNRASLSGNPVRIDLSSLKEGIYTAVFFTNEGSGKITEKLVIVK